MRDQVSLRPSHRHGDARRSPRSTLEYYRGKPGNLQSSRQARLESLAEGGGVAALEVDDYGFASADEILKAAGASVKAVEALARDKEEAARKERALAKQEAARKDRAKHEAQVQARATNHSVSTLGSCYPDGYKIELVPGRPETSDYPVNVECGSLTDEQLKAGMCCWSCYDHDSYGECASFTLFEKCAYTFRQKSPKESENCKGYDTEYYKTYWNYKVGLSLWEVDYGHDDRCYEKQENSLYCDDITPNGWNEFYYSIPPAKQMKEDDCSQGDAS